MPLFFEGSLNTSTFRRDLVRQSLPFLLLEIAGIASLFIPPGPRSFPDALWAMALLIFVMPLFTLPLSFLAGKGNLLIPLTALASSLFIVRAGGGPDGGADLILFVPLLWTTLYLARWSSRVVLAATIVVQFATSNVLGTVSSAIRWRRTAMAALFGVLLVYAIHELRDRARRIVTQREEAHGQLREALAMLSRRDRLLTSMSQGVVITDARQRGNPITYASPGVERLTGFELQEILGKPLHVLQGPDAALANASSIHDWVASGDDSHLEIVRYQRNGVTFWHSLALSVIRDDVGQVANVLGLMTDVCEHRELEGLLMQAQKMEVVGTLAAGMAHDFNNSLLVIRGYNSLIARDARDEHLLSLTQRVDEAVSEAAAITHRLLAYSRYHDTNPEFTDVNRRVTETFMLWKRLLGDQIICRLDLEENLDHVLIDPSQLEQALVNLITNAADAMPDGGTLTIRTLHFVVDDDSVMLSPPHERGRYIVVEITDSGSGMNDETTKMIFNPFFTTKVLSTGLGLPTVVKVIAQAGGHLEVTSRLDEGTTFRIYLPATPLPLINGDPLTESPYDPVAS